ncbi:hypothetical protein [Arthrobacter sp. StoSoilB13]|uniref:hypothetical protein n=1 Tax=Arthrobacter sp. StoSoilB13 TaxID=2830993 RepID=UPI001CC670F7|nr:hypothetical protein [Arthrobacter sp. StoSoilB13]
MIQVRSVATLVPAGINVCVTFLSLVRSMRSRQSEDSFAMIACARQTFSEQTAQVPRRARHTAAGSV